MSDKMKQFLFQTGAIKSISYHITIVSYHDSSFYSKLVRLKGERGKSEVAMRQCFYSKLVRLKVTQRILLNNNPKPLFLFQTGAIKRETEE